MSDTKEQLCLACGQAVCPDHVHDCPGPQTNPRARTKAAVLKILHDEYAETWQRQDDAEKELAKAAPQLDALRRAMARIEQEVPNDTPNP